MIYVRYIAAIYCCDWSVRGGCTLYTWSNTNLDYVDPGMKF